MQHMDGFYKHNIKLKKLNTKENILYDSINIKRKQKILNAKIQNSDYS
jgi:hypothetical protein